MGKVLLCCLKFFRPILEKAGVEFDQMYAIVQSKLLMDKRRVSTFSQFTKKKDYSTDVILAIVYFITGCFLLIFFVLFKPMHTAFSFYFTVLIFYVVFLLLSDFSDVLFDVRDNYLILPTPISETTLIYAKLCHLLIFMIKIELPFLLPAIIFVAIKYSILAMLLFVFQSILCLILAILLVNMSYVIIFRLVSVQTFKDVINYFQIAVVALAVSAYNLMSGIFTVEEFNVDIPLEEKWYSYFVPGAWIAGLGRLLLEGKYDMYSVVLSILAIAVPLACLLVISKIFSKGYISKLLMLSNSGDGSNDNKKKVIKYKVGDFLGKLFRWSSLESAGYKFSMQMTSRSRTFKLRTYPIYAMLPSLLFYQMMQGDGDSFGEKFDKIVNGRYDLLVTYFLVFLIIIPLFYTKFSDNYKSARSLMALPIESPGKFIRGNLNAILVKFGLPTIILSCVIIFTIWGLGRWDTVVTMIVHLFLASTFITIWSLARLPFSESWENLNKGQNTAFSIMSMIVAGIFGLVHYFLLLRFPIVHLS